MFKSVQFDLYQKLSVLRNITKPHIGVPLSSVLACLNIYSSPYQGKAVVVHSLRIFFVLLNAHLACWARFIGDGDHSTVCADLRQDSKVSPNITTHFYHSPRCAVCFRQQHWCQPLTILQMRLIVNQLSGKSICDHSLAGLRWKLLGLRKSKGE